MKKNNIIIEWYTYPTCLFVVELFNKFIKLKTISLINDAIIEK